ncbi:hypothetical protein DM02DRAFT_413875 [Periconia macrospinosa]|uniref:Uncharacterized protein n=1 Tax=Periconia macrospinosa TaxID=97972 RepID=A0A2V1DRB2_9PLEO|nr:hypothetical protein DM02DRAFT_413875 [Periconia macrospinosa]
MDDLNDDDYDSSDIEVPPTNTTPKVFGKASIDRIIDNAKEDRRSSKIAFKTLALTHNSPGAEYASSLWVSRFQAFREHTLRQPTTQPFTSEDLIRFFDVIIGKVRSRGPCPNARVVQLAMHYLQEWGEFTWADFHLSAHDHQLINAWKNDAIQKARLSTGSTYQRSWIGYATLSRLVREFLLYRVTNGTLTLDPVIAKVLSVVLMSALGCRAGDIALSDLYSGNEFLSSACFQLRSVIITLGIIVHLAHLINTQILDFTASRIPGCQGQFKQGILHIPRKRRRLTLHSAWCLV